MNTQSNSGFTLIELMIVVGIIGILSALAVPNFIRYQAKAKQSEARLSLAAIYTGNKSFYSEYSSYTSDLSFVGWAPEGKTYYRAGFSALFPSTGIPGIVTFSGTTHAVGSQTGAVCGVGELTPAAVGQETFTAYACGTIRTGVTADKWSITDTKVLTNTIPGI